MKLKNLLPLILGVLFPIAGFSAATIHYELSFPEPQTHYVEVKMEIDGVKSKSLEVKMPVWAPGSYLIREFSRFVDSFSVSGENGEKLDYVKISKNGWRITNSGNDHLTIRYKVYAYELSVRTSFIDDEHAYLNGASIFLFADEFLKSPCTVMVHPYASWKKMSVALDPVEASNPWMVKAANYDELVDTPFEIGNHLVFSFISSGVTHEVAMFGEGNFDVEKLKKDMARITEECASVFGEHPSPRYLFIIHNLNNGGGGLEHKNSTTLQTSKWGYSSESSYNGFLSLVAHEYFHLWNVKRLRPVPLGPFNYDAENYTTLLWVAEGFTAYYDDLITRRCGFYSDADYLKTLAGSISYCDNVRGAAFQTLSESSLEAWIKYYRTSENSGNTTVSYYTKGGVVGALLDMKIMKLTNGAKSLDDVMREMYQLYAKKLNRGYTEKEFVDMTSKIAGVPMDDFFRRFVNGTDSLPMKEAVKALGLELTDLNEFQITPWTGLTTAVQNGKLVVTAVERNSPAWNSGINVNDELIAFDQYRLSDDLAKFTAMKKVGDKVSFTVSRGGYIKTYPLSLGAAPYVKFSLDKSTTADPVAKKLFEKWLKIN